MRYFSVPELRDAVIDSSPMLKPILYVRLFVLEGQTIRGGLSRYAVVMFSRSGTQ